MERVFGQVATFAVALIVATACLGLWIGDLHGQTDPVVIRWATVHRLSGVLAALLVVLVNSMAVTYFIGTGRWCREVADTYGLGADYDRRSRALKRRGFPPALLGMLAVVGIVALGGAADPATGRPGTAAWVTPHLIGSLALGGVIGWSFLAQIPGIRRQHELVEEVLTAVRRVRVERGLEVDSAASAVGGEIG